METLFGFLIGVGLGLVVSVPLGLVLAYFIICRQIDYFLLTAGTEAKGLVAKLVSHTVSQYSKKQK